jgi:predicted DNA-binding transcriptional regulator YafY
VVRWVRERQHYGYRGDEVSDETEDDQGVIMRFEVEDFGEIKAWLLGWGADAEPLEPLKLREMMREEVEKMRKMLLT